MDWQQEVLDVALEIIPETGLFAYREVIVTVPRQQGKTAGLVLPVTIDRCTMWPEAQRVVYTAQSGLEARKKLLEDQFPVVKKSIFHRETKRYYEGAGNEGVLFRNGSRWGLAAKAKSSGHGFTLDLGILDECWDDEDDRREQTMLPTMNTRPMAQIWIVSTQGTEDSVYLNRKTEMGRAAAAADCGSGIAYFEWSIPGESDICDPEVWWENMPALGWTIQPNVVAHALATMNESEWRRAFGNQRTRGTAERVIPEVVWEAVQDVDAQVDREGRATFGVDVHPERGSAAIAVADAAAVGLVEHREGTGWVHERARELHDRWQGGFVFDGGGPAASLAADLEADGLPVQRLGGPEVVAACARIYDAIADARLVVRTDERINTAVAGLAKRPVGDRFVWDRRASSTDITPFMAATLAYAWAANAQPEVRAAIY